MSAKPHVYWDQEAEQSALGAALISPNACALISQKLSPTDFYLDTNRVIFKAILKRYRRGENVDVVTVAADLPEELRPMVHTWAEFVPTAANARDYVAAVLRESEKRQLQAAAVIGLQQLESANGDGPARFRETMTAVLEATPGESHPAARITSLADIAPEQLRSLWPGRLYLGKIALLIGDPGMAKTFLALHIASVVSRGGYFPDGTRAPHGSVVILTAEDGLADTIRPRLDHMGADVGRVWALQTVRGADDKGERTFSLQRDVEALEEVVAGTQARLVIIDPLDAYLQGVDSHRNAEVRTVLAPLAAMLERTGAAGLLVHHLNKDSSTVNALYRAGGSLGFVAAARSVLGVAQDTEDETRRVLLSLKLNIGAKPEGLAYRVSDRGIEWDSAPVTVNASQVFGPPGRGDSDLKARAKDLLQQELADGEWHTQRDLQKVAAEVGVSVAVLKKAKLDLHVKSKLEGYGAAGKWHWRLPAKDES